MDATLKKICADHRLSRVSIAFASGETSRVTVFVHWAADACGMGDGETFDEALTSALADMASRRKLEDA